MNMAIKVTQTKHMYLYSSSHLYSLYMYLPWLTGKIYRMWSVHFYILSEFALVWIIR